MWMVLKDNWDKQWKSATVKIYKRYYRNFGLFLALMDLGIIAIFSYRFGT